jgi:hypothetical protein
MIPVSNSVRVLTNTTGGLFVHEFPALLGAASWSIVVDDQNQAVGTVTLFDGTTEESEAVTIPTSGLFEIATDNYYVRIGVDGTVYEDSVLSVEYVVPFNNVVGMTDYEISALPKTQYRAIYLLSDTAQDVTVSQVSHDGEVFVSSLQFGADTEGSPVQEIGGGTVAPTGITFADAPTITLSANVPRAVWVKSVLASTAPVGIHHTKIQVTSENDPTLALRGAYKVADATLDGYCLYLGEETDTAGGVLVAVGEGAGVATAGGGGLVGPTAGV